ncbi:NAD(P)H-binding protein [Halopseudomonas salina]|uniref:NAD-dependent dehydratase n=1 Tax=Halopseudomonas salina TaxID=1323744 RepID=A0ABQ1P8B5_9GAMM|nr:NAD(P)H-binding protein [Halopseudomonas salina]GGC93175.1 NAD-dependent dehydratase [Halopseudomonas salina]
MSEQSTKTLLILGGTGLVGSMLIEQALADPQVLRVIAPTRRPLKISDRLLNPLVDFDELPRNATWWRVDAVLCALGTTRSQAGSREKFYRVDHDYVLQAATLAQQAGTPVFVLNSSMGAEPLSRSLYLRTKGQIEKDLETLGFSSLTHVRPSLLAGGVRPEFRLGESIGLWLARLLQPVIPARYQAVQASDVAAVMLAAAVEPRPGTSIVQSDQIKCHHSAKDT